MPKETYPIIHPVTLKKEDLPLGSEGTSRVQLSLVLVQLHFLALSARERLHWHLLYAESSEMNTTLVR